MAERLKQERIGAVAIVRLETLPGHLPDEAGRRALLGYLSETLSDSGARALVLIPTANLPEGPCVAEDPAAEASLAELCARLEDAGIAVVAALEGEVASGGADLALAAHFRLATPDVTFRWPDAALGRFAGGVGVQRLTRIAGAGRALDWLLSGRPVTAQEAVEADLVDGVVRGDLEDAAISLARRLAEAGAGARPSRARSEGLSDRQAFIDAVAKARAKWRPAKGSAEERIVECVEAALVLPFETAAGFEMAAATELAASGRAQALGYLEQAARSATQPTLRTETPLASLGFYGVGTEAAALSCSALRVGVRVVLADKDPARLKAGLDRIGQNLSAAVAAGDLDAAERAACLARLSSASRLDALSGCTLVLFGGDTCLPMTSRISNRAKGVLGPAIACPDTAPEPRLGAEAVALFPVSGGDRAKLLEILAPESASGLAGALRDLALAMGHQPVVTRSAAGGAIAGRLAEAILVAAEHLLEDGATPRQIDSALEAAGYRCGPLRMFDAVGIEPVLARREAAADTRDPRERYVAVLERLVAAGRTGRDAGQGFYDYPDGIPEGIASAEVERLVAEARAESGVAPRVIDDAQIVQRCHLALVLEALRLLEAGAVRAASDIDVIAVYGLGYPRETGGPLYEAGRTGLVPLRDRLVKLARDEDARYWTPPPILERLISRGGKLSA